MAKIFEIWPILWKSGTYGHYDIRWKMSENHCFKDKMTRWSTLRWKVPSFDFTSYISDFLLPVTFSSSYWTPFFLFHQIPTIAAYVRKPPSNPSHQPQGWYAGWDQPPLFSCALQAKAPELSPSSFSLASYFCHPTLETVTYQATSQEQNAAGISSWL